jgi:outer membrane scaffolding protein for murein synthesis (MipA/OmpV family)
MVGPEVKLVSAKLNDAYFGVTRAASLRAAAYGNKISPYSPGAGVEAVSLNIDSRYVVSEHWSVLGRADLDVLVGRDAHSPLTRQRFQPEIGLFVMYGF